MNAMFVMMHDKIGHANAAKNFSLAAALSLITDHRKNSHIVSASQQEGIQSIMNQMHL
jgi:hypothetical protein